MVFLRAVPRINWEHNTVEDELKAVRHETLGAIDRGEKLLKALEGKSGKAIDALRDSTDRLVLKLKKELERWETKYKKAKAKASR